MLIVAAQNRDPVFAPFRACAAGLQVELLGAVEPFTEVHPVDIVVDFDCPGR
jgi:hypothetical protein